MHLNIMEIGNNVLCLSKSKNNEVLLQFLWLPWAGLCTSPYWPLQFPDSHAFICWSTHWDLLSKSCVPWWLVSIGPFPSSHRIYWLAQDIDTQIGIHNLFLYYVLIFVISAVIGIYGFLRARMSRIPSSDLGTKIDFPKQWYVSWAPKHC